MDRRIYTCEHYEGHSSISFSSPDLKQMHMNLLTALKSSKSETTLNCECMIDFVYALEDIKVHLHCYKILGLKEELLNSVFFYGA